MGDSLFDIFGDLTTRSSMKNVARQPLMNVENMGKTVFTGPIKPNEPKKQIDKISDLKKPGEQKKSFLSNTGKALQSTPMRQALTPRAVNVGSLIYSDLVEKKCKDFDLDELQFTKPSHKIDNFQADTLDCFDILNNNYPCETLELCEPQMYLTASSPVIQRPSMEFNYSYQDEFFTDDFSNDTFPDIGEDNISIPEIN